ncbi:MAG: ABC transporter permease [Bdellovibrio sp.]|nr:ABC transporter permease [Bdellovibrio sp.]
MKTTNHILDYLDALLRELFKWHKNRHVSLLVLINQVLFTGFEALTPILVSSFLLGGLVAYTGRTFLSDLGQNQLIYNLIIMAVIRDVGPLITGLIILLRSGTAITTELGSMRVNREIDALETMGISSMSYLVVPRVMGMVFSLLILGAYFTLMGLIGAYVTFFWLAKIPFTDFFLRFTNALNAADLYIPLVKAVFSGLLIGTLCSFHGLRVGRALTEVPQRAIKAVTQCVLALLFLHGIIALISFSLEGV